MVELIKFSDLIAGNTGHIFVLAAHYRLTDGNARIKDLYAMQHVLKQPNQGNRINGTA